jgi:hypothetical protein
MEFNFTVKAYDSDDNEIVPGNCGCGNPGVSAIIGINCLVWLCHKCIYGHVKIPPNTQVEFRSNSGVRFLQFEEENLG